MNDVTITVICDAKPTVTGDWSTVCREAGKMKRSKLSGAQYKKSKRQREQAAEKDAAPTSRWLSQTSHTSGIDVATAGTAVRAVEAPESSDEAESASSVGEGEHSTNEPDTLAAMTVSEEVDSEVGSAISTATDITDSRIFSDIGYLKYPVADELRLELVKRGAEPLQHTDGPFEVVNGRSLTSSWFTCILQNQKTVPRTWLLYSPSKGCAFCFCCLLFKADGQEHGSFGCADGFRAWKKLNPCV